MVIAAVLFALVLNVLYRAGMYAWSSRARRSEAGAQALRVGPGEEPSAVFTGKVVGWAYTAPFACLVLRRDSATIEVRSLWRHPPERTFERVNLDRVRLRRGVGSLTVRFEGGGLHGSDFAFMAFPEAGLRDALAELGWLEPVSS